MGFVKKTWKNRISEYINRYRMTVEGTDTSKNVLLDLNDGVVSETGDTFDATTMNDLEQRIEDGFNSIPEPSEEKKTGTLETGETTIAFTFTQQTIGENTLVFPFSETYGVSPTDVSIEGQVVTLTYDEQEADMKVGVLVKN